AHSIPTPCASLRLHSPSCFYSTVARAVFLFHIPPPPGPPLFPYTTLFRSPGIGRAVAVDDAEARRDLPLAGAELFSLRHRRPQRSEEHTSELQSREKIVCRLLLEEKNRQNKERKSLTTLVQTHTAEGRKVD